MKNTQKSNHPTTPVENLEVVKTEKSKPHGPVSTPVIVHVHNRHRIRNVVHISMLMPILLLVIRHYIPEIEQNIPHVYQFLDQVAIPIIEWSYQLGLKAFHWLMNQEWFANIIQVLADLAV